MTAGGLAKPSSAGLCRDPRFTLTSCLNWSNWSNWPGGHDLFDQPPCTRPDKGSLTN